MQIILNNSKYCEQSESIKTGSTKVNNNQSHDRYVIYPIKYILIRIVFLDNLEYL